MSLTKETVVDQITVSIDGSIVYRENTRILEDGKEISHNYHRVCLIPIQEYTDLPTSVQAICNTVWTEEVKSAYRAVLETRRA
jgi:archaellum component FlaF (FlaF/FlaG flagellin family)